MDALAQRFGAGCLNGVQPIAQDRAQDVDHLTVTVRHAAKLALDASHRRRKLPVLEWRTIPQSTGFASQNRDVVQWVVDRFVATEGTRMLANDLSVLPELYPLGIGTDLHRPANRTGLHRVSVLVEPD